MSDFEVHPPHLVRRLQEENEALAKALAKISAHQEMTLLYECCVNGTCSPAIEEGVVVAACTHQLGVMRGFNQCAAEALEALEARRKRLEGERVKNPG